MTRIKIKLPSLEIAVVKIPVRITDINYGNHTGNDAFISILHEARMQWLKQHAYTELNFAGTALIMSDLQIEFKNESYYGDMIEIKIFCGEIAGVSFELYYQLTTTRENKNILLANAKTGMVCYDYQHKKTMPVNETVRKILLAALKL